MKAFGILPIATGLFAFIAAGAPFRRAADPLAMLERIKQRRGINYTRMVSDPEKYAAHIGRLSAFSGVFLIVVGLVLTLAGVVVLAMPSPEEQRARNATVQEQIRRSDEQMRDYFRQQDEERMKHIFDVHPPTTAKTPS